MEGELAEVQLGAHAKLDVKFEAGSLMIEVMSDVGASNVTKVDAKTVLEALKKACGSEYANIGFDLLEKALGL